MANTVMTAKNTFAEGLVMDFAPDNTQATTLTSALNATLLTFNGNEMALQNDMGNGRVETAYLPEGYVPVGTCEFGDIIYIVSYNPLINKSLIGCFPSPERNISSEETGSTNLTLSANDFQEIKDGLITGKLKTNSIKKILYNNKLSPGDKFIIYDKSHNILYNSDTITDIGNISHTYGVYPKLLKIHVVAIEDSGKINYLDSSVVWYNKKLGEKNLDYFILQTSEGSSGPDLDSYRSLVSSAYSTFLGKVSGKLALLVELEKIRNFSCTYDVYKIGEETRNENDAIIKYSNYRLFLNTTWDSNDININPSYLVLTKSKWSGKKENKGGIYYKYKKNEKNNEYYIDYDSLDSEIQIGSIYPVAYNNTMYNSDYWYTLFHLSYDYSLPFSDSKQNYKSSEAQYLTNNKSSLGMKISIDRKNGMPNRISNDKENYGYYINAHHALIEDGLLVYYRSTGSTFEKILPLYINDDIINNYYKTGVYKEFAEFSIPTKLLIQDVEYDLDISNLIYNFEISPAMPYGILEDLAQEGFIDFSKIGSGKIDLTKWAYYNSENVSLLNIGMDIYPESNKNVLEIVLEFYDNLGIAAAYHIGNKQSYSGLFMEYIPLNGLAYSYKLNNVDHLGNTIYHAGEVANLNIDKNLVYYNNGIPYLVIIDSFLNEQTKYYYKESNNQDPILINDLTKLYVNDSGILYSNFLYLVKIIVKYTSFNAIGELDSSDTSNYKLYYRWYWTNTMFNSYYYSVLDFDSLKPELTLDINSKYIPAANYVVDRFNYPNLVHNNKADGNNFLPENLNCIVLTISGDVSATIEAGLILTYDTFNLENAAVNNIKITTYLGKLYVDSGLPEIKYSLNDFVNNVEPIMPIDSDLEYDISKYGPALKDKLTRDTNTNKEINSSDYANYKNQFKVSLKLSTGEQTISYIGYGNEEVLDLKCISYESDNLNSVINFNIDLINFSKFGNVYTNTTSIIPVLESVINENNYGDYLLSWYELDHHFYVNRCHYLSMGGHTYAHKGNSKSATDIGVASYELGTGNRFLRQPGTSDLWDDIGNGHDDMSLFSGNRNGTILETHFKHNNDLALAIYANKLGFVLYSRWSSNDGSNDDSFALFTGKNISTEEYDSNGFGNFPSNVGSISSEHTKYFNHPYLDGRFGSCSIDSPDPNSQGGPVVWLAFNDWNHNLFHYFNDVFLTSGRGFEDLSQKINYSGSMYGINRSALPTTIGDALMSVLTSMYKYSGEIQTTVLRLYNFIYLSNYSTNYIKDIIYKAEITLDINNLCIQGIKYGEYINTVQEKCFAYKGNNIDISIRNCIKNIPLLFKIDYIYTYPSDEIEKTALIKTFGLEPIYALYSIVLDKNKIYQCVDGKISTVNANFLCRWIKETTFDNISATYTTVLSDEYAKNPNLWRIFYLDDGKLALATTKRPTEPSYEYSYWSRERGDHHKEYISLSDLIKYENIVPFAKLV